MSKSGNRICLAGLVILGLFMTLPPAWAEDPEDIYQRMYVIIQQADSLDAGGQGGQALAKYREAQKLLRDLKAENPLWNKDAVAYRFNYLTQKIGALSQAAAKPAAGGPAPGTQEGQPASSASERQAKLLEAGAEPRKVLRLHPEPGTKQSMKLTIKIATDVKAGPMPAQSMKLPTIQMTLDTTVKTVSPDGDILYDLTIGNADVAADSDANPQVAQAIKAAFSGFSGLSGSGTTSDHGFAKGTDMKTPAGANPQLRQIVDQMKEAFSGWAVPVPEGAVGPGARWEVKLPVKTQGMTIDQTAVYQLVSIEGDRPTVKYTVEQRASKQKVQNPGMPGMTLDLTKLTGKGSGEATFDLSRLMPLEGTSTVVTESVMEMNVGGQKAAMTMKTSMDVRLEGK